MIDTCNPDSSRRSTRGCSPKGYKYPPRVLPKRYLNSTSDLLIAPQLVTPPTTDLGIGVSTPRFNLGASQVNRSARLESGPPRSSLQ
ncbi:hypothetical protein SLA2020_075550 [Shorea laevis]